MMPVIAGNFMITFHPQESHRRLLGRDVPPIARTHCVIRRLNDMRKEAATLILSSEARSVAAQRRVMLSAAVSERRRGSKSLFQNLSCRNCFQKTYGLKILYPCRPL
jgi:hypothetical protein